MLQTAKRSYLLLQRSLSWNCTQSSAMIMSLESGMVRPHSSSPSPRPEKRTRLDVQTPIPDDANEITKNGGHEYVELSPPVTQDAHTLPERGSRVKKRRQRRPKLEPYSPEDVLYHDVVSVLTQKVVDTIIAAGKDWDAPLPFGTEVELVVDSLSSGGDSLSVIPPPHPPWVFAVPFALPGERIHARVYRSARLVSMADLVRIETPNLALRDMSRVKCKYFGRCAGCQYQMMSYDDQLELKRKIVDKAYQNFSELDPDSIPTTLATIASPKQYGYRTKITPHFDLSSKKVKGSAGASRELHIGFAEKGRRTVMDIEECPIATPVLNSALGPTRQRVKENIHKYKRGATLLLRDSLVTTTVGPCDTVDSARPTALAVDTLSDQLEQHVCITDHKAIVRERIGSLDFEFPAGSFFQNNNSVLTPLTEYVRDAVRETPVAPTHLVDAYCGSGLFAITLARHFARVAGVEISAESIRYARHNAARNGIPAETCMFHAGQAEAIFASVADFPPERTVVVVDPPRKGCDVAFIEQLLAFGPATVVYVSCNVHTQARDVGMILRRKKGYELKSLRGFDLFPQTAHVESVAVLRKEGMS